jgi:hypothetical protein
MYDLRFDEAHQIFAVWRTAHPEDPMGPVSDAAGYLFSELARLGILESEFFLDNTPIAQRARSHPDPAKKAQFVRAISDAERLADAALAKSPADTNALFVKSMTFGLRADNAGLIEKQPLTALSLTKEGRTWAERLMTINPNAGDGYLGPGVENYLLSLKPAPLRLLLRFTGSNVDHDKGLEEIRQTALHGHYLEPFGKLILAVAALRDHNPTQARAILAELHMRFPDNDLYTRELTVIGQAGH